MSKNGASKKENKKNAQKVNKGKEELKKEVVEEVETEKKKVSKKEVNKKAEKDIKKTETSKNDKKTKSYNIYNDICFFLCSYELLCKVVWRYSNNSKKFFQKFHSNASSRRYINKKQRKNFIQKKGFASFTNSLNNGNFRHFMQFLCNR